MGPEKLSPEDILHIKAAIRNMIPDQPYQVHLPSGKPLLHGAILSGSEWRRKLKLITNKKPHTP